MITVLVISTLIIFICLTVYAYWKSPAVRHWKSVLTGVLLTIVMTCLSVESVIRPSGKHFGFPLKFVTLYSIDDVAFDQKFSFDLAFFYINVLFWSLIVYIVLKAVKCIDRMMFK